MTPKSFTHLPQALSANRWSVALCALLLASCAREPAEPAVSASPESPGAAPAVAPAAEPPEAVASTLPASRVGSCSSPAVGMCTDFTGPDHTVAQVKQDCAGPGQVYSEFGCPVEGRVGSCLSYPAMGIEIQQRFFQAVPGGTAAAKAMCLDMAKGTWTPD